MIKFITCLIVSILIYGGATAVYAEGRNYVGLSYNNIDYDETGFATVEPTALVFQLGHEFGRIFSIEGRLGAGVNDGTITDLPFDTKMQILSLVGGYLKWQIPNEKFKPYFMLGYTSIDLEIESLGYYATGKEKGGSYGFGLDFLFSPNFAMNLEYMDYFSGETEDGFGVDVEITSTNFGLKYFF